MMSPISLQSKRIATIALAPRAAGLLPHPLPGLVPAVGKQPRVPDDLPATDRHELGADVAEDIADPHDKAEDVPVDHGDPVAGDLVGGRLTRRSGLWKRLLGARKQGTRLG